MTDTLSRAEAQERARQVAGVSYQVALDLTGGEDTFRSETVVRFTAPLVGLATFVDLDAESVSAITFNGRTLDPTAAYDAPRSRIPLRGLLANNELRVEAECAYQRSGVGLHRMVDPVDGNVYLHSQFEPFDAHRVFACFDQPDLKASFSLTVTAPESWTVVSNSPVAASEGGVWRFAPTPVMSTYLAAVVAGPYHQLHDRHGELDLGLYCRQSLAPHLDAGELLELTRQGLDFFTAEFDYPYPFAKYDQLFVPEFNFGAMENPGCVTFNESMVFRSRVTEAARESRATTLLHEMAHMWFGDLVTMRWWDDLWLNESFATYMASHAAAQATRFQRAWVRFATTIKGPAAVQDQLPTTHPISADIVDTDAVRLHFDGITYGKGASVLKQLVAWVGPDAFRTGLQGYFVEHEWSNAALTDFLAALEATSGRDLGTWSRVWLETAGVNTLRPAFELDEDGRYGALAVLQEATPAHPTLRPHRLRVGAYVVDGDTVVRHRQAELDLVGSRSDAPDLAGGPQPDLLLVNDDDLTYAKVRLDERSLETLAAHLSGIADPLARNLCWAATWDMVRDAELATHRFVDLVLAHAGGEEDEAVLSSLLGRVTAGVNAFGDPANRPAARARLASAAATELDAAEAGSDRQLIWARHWLANVDDPGGLARARAVLDADAEIKGLAVDTDLRWAIVGVLASHGADDEGAVIEAELGRDPTDIGERRAAAGRASRPTPEARAGAWEQLIAGGISLALARALVGGFAQFGQEELVRPYVDPYYDSVVRFWEERPREEALTLIEGLYPSVLVEDGVVAATDRLLAEDTLPGPARRILLEAQDGVRRAARARAADRG